MIQLDTSVPALLVKIGRYPIHHGGLNAARSLGRLGVPVYALSERRYTPAARSRYLAGVLDWSTTGHEQPAALVERLLGIGKALGRKAIPYATDDEAAILLAEHADALREHFLLPAVPAHLPRELNSKRGLYEHCVSLGIAAPRTVFPRTPDELTGLAGELRYPVIAKNTDAWGRLVRPFVPGTVRIADEAELLSRFGGYEDLTGLLLQEYLPLEHAEDWFCHFVVDPGGTCVFNVSARKLRSWPPGAGWTAYAQTDHNPAVTELCERLAKAVGWRGIGDVDIRYDRRSGQYHLLDFNPRIGAQHFSAVTEAGVDTVRALHLVLTGRPVPASPPDVNRQVVVETIDYRARRSYRGLPAPVVPRPGLRTVRGWWAPDDPVPYALMLARGAYSGVARLWRS
jgi:D-aspartate ligase